jgi:putative hemolysin
LGSLDPGDPLSYSLFQLYQATSNILKFEYITALIGCAVLLLLSALVSGAEAAFFSLSPQDLSNLKKSPKQQERKIVSLLEDPRQLLTRILIINNSINVTIITLFAYLAWRLLGPALSVIETIGSVLFVTFLVVFFGEIIPKVYARKKPVVIAARVLPVLNILQIPVKPLAWLLGSISSYINTHYMSKGYHHTLEDLHHSLDIALTNEETSPEERKILRGVVNFGAITVKQIMRPRIDLIAFKTSLTLPELYPEILKWGYSRVPVYSKSIDTIEGILYVKDLLPHLEKGPDFKWQKLIRTPLFVPELKRIADLFQEFKEKHVHMAIVLNEYGVTAGLLTMEDIIEEIVGDINDEFDDDDDIIYSQLDKNTFIFEGKASLHDFCKIIEIPFDTFNEVKGENETVAGLVIALFSKIPTVGEEVHYQNFHFTIESADSTRVKRVKINVSSKKEQYYKAG